MTHNTGPRVAEKVLVNTTNAANAMTKLAPNSYHLLITGAGPLQDGKDIRLTLTFAHSSPITILALVTNPESGGASYFLN